MAKIQKLIILNPSDKTRMYSVATGHGAPADADDPIVTEKKKFPVGSQYTDLVGKKFYVRTAVAGVVADWTAVTA